MGNLVLAGLVSGAGQGLEKSAGIMQQTLAQQSLLEQREKMELERLRITEGYASDREQRGYAQAKELAGQSQTAAAALQEKSLASHEAVAGQQIASQEYIHGDTQAQETARHADTQKGETERHKDTIGSAKEIAGIKEAGDDRRTGMTIAGQKAIHAEENKVKREELASRERTESEKTKTMRAHYESQDKYWAALAEKARAGVATKADYQQAKIYGDFLQERMKGLQEQMKLATPDERDKLQDEMDGMQREMKQILGIQQVQQAPSAQIVDPFKRPKPAPNTVEDTGTAAAAPPPNGLLQQPYGASGGW